MEYMLSLSGINAATEGVFFLMDLPAEDILANNVSLPEPLPDVFEELSFSDSSEFLEVDEDTSLRKRLFPQILPGSLLNQNLVQGGDSDDFGSLDMSLPARAAEQAENIVRKVLEEAENAEQLVRKIWGGAWKVCHFSHLPKWLQDNDFLHKGHRPPLRSFSACFRSIFRIHTETGNIWTHLLGCLLFVGIAAYFLSRPSGLIPWEEKVVFATFFASAIICLGMSSMFHTVSCHSEHIGRLFSKLDYCGIAVLIIGSFVPWLYYGFYCDYQPKVFYFVLVSVLGAASIIVSMWDKFSEPQFRWLRAGVFAGFGLSGVIPALHYLIVKGFFQAVYHASFGWLCLMGALYLLGACFYALRVPERFFPGKCDIWFHSHQIFHVLVIAAAFVHYHGISEMAIYRLSMGTCSAEDAPIDFEY
ncbi:adiponectin receptor protein [Trichonephila inaurata madagascariensis]|uniref:Adiponectin receptor protein n=1 Tax=Trichonephila inaurata madagascariensis TaxID=2747483 RepID=A0A8X6YQD4_9ARAC|nr:adiponectin receptor protein [Trichonephila inaurata madagascariensis]